MVMKLLIHPGFHKTGTSWLQETIFADENVFRSLLDHASIDQLFLRDHDFFFDHLPAKVAIGEAIAQTGEGIVPVVSSEILSGNPFDGSRDSRIMADRLHAACPDARILLTVRAPTAFAKAMYVQYLKRGGRMTPKRFFSYEPEPGYRWFDAQCLDFGRLAEHYASLFGAENVLVLPQEMLRKDRAGYLGQLVSFASDGTRTDVSFPMADRKVGESPPASGLFLMRLGNAFFPSTMNPEAFAPKAIGRILQRAAYSWSFGKSGAARRLDAVVNDAINASDYARSNAVLQRFCPADLGELGYVLPTSGQSA